MIDRWPFRHGTALGAAALMLLFIPVVFMLQAGATQTGPVGDPYAGEWTFGDQCASCHGWYGEGTLEGNSLLAVWAVEPFDGGRVESAIREGIGEMEPVAGLDDQQIADISAFLRLMARSEGYAEVLGEPPSPRG